MRMRYKDLPQPRSNTPLKGGGTLLARQPVLYCRGCGEAYSANPGDYWDREGEIAPCEACDTPLVLAEARPHTYIPYGTDSDFARYLDAAWSAAEETDGN